jgi:sRNA-binding carbon storage regulator CsrA
MLFLTRRVGGKVIITVPPSQEATVVEVELVRLTAEQARLAFDAPDDVVIDREEIHLDKVESMRFAAATEAAIRR